MNNPPAFPCDLTMYDEEVADTMRGMTLRDYFAAKAMQALLSDSDWRQDMDITDTALAAYKTADAMLKARQA